MSVPLGQDRIRKTHRRMNKPATSARKYKSRIWNRYRQSKSYNDLVEYKIEQRPRNSSRLRYVDEFTRQEDSVDLFRCADVASFHSLFSVQTRGSVTGDVTCPQSSGLCNATLAGIPQHLLRQLQSVMNAADRLTYCRGLITSLRSSVNFTG